MTDIHVQLRVEPSRSSFHAGSFDRLALGADK